jgi:hypothetical protein
MTPSFFPKTVGVVTELTIVGSREDHADDFRQEFVAPDGHIHSTLPPLPRDLWSGSPLPIRIILCMASAFSSYGCAGEQILISSFVCLMATMEPLQPV